MPSARHLELERFVRIIFLTMFSGVLCAWSSCLRQGWSALENEWLEAAGFGGSFALFVSPFIIPALIWRPLPKSAALMLPCSMLAAFLGGYSVGVFGYFLGMAVMVPLAWFARWRLPDIRPPADPPFQCSACGYSLKGLPHLRCPECGHNNNQSRKT